MADVIGITNLCFVDNWVSTDQGGGKRRAGNGVLVCGLRVISFLEWDSFFYSSLLFLACALSD
jgi:hypothetical protein